MDRVHPLWEQKSPGMWMAMCVTSGERQREEHWSERVAWVIGHNIGSDLFSQHLQRGCGGLKENGL